MARAKITEEDMEMSVTDPLAAMEDTEPSDETGWQADETEKAVCIRHRYLGGDVCLRCGQPKPQPTSKPRETGVVRRRSPGLKTSQVESFLSTAWMAMGIATERYVPEPPGPPVGRMIQMEAGVAGTRILAALKPTPVYPWLMRATTGPFADLAPIIAPPLLVGALSFNPALRERLKPIIVSMLLPIVAENMKRAQEQEEAMQTMLMSMNRDHFDIANQLFDSLFESKGDKDDSTS